MKAVVANVRIVNQTETTLKLLHWCWEFVSKSLKLANRNCHNLLLKLYGYYIAFKFVMTILNGILAMHNVT